MANPHESEQIANLTPEKKRRSFNVIREKDTIIPLLQLFIPDKRAVIKATWKDYKDPEYSSLSEEECKKMNARITASEVTANKILFTELQRKIHMDGLNTLEGIDFLNQTFNTKITSTFVNGRNILNKAYQPEITDSIIMGANILHGDGPFEQLSSRRVSGMMLAAKGLLAENQETYLQGLREFSKENRKERTEVSPWLKQIANTKEGEYYQQFLKYGNLAAAAFEIDGRLAEASTLFNSEGGMLQNHGGETYNVRINNSLIIGEHILKRSVGGEIRNSILAFDEQQPFDSTCKIRLVNSYVMNARDYVYVEDEFVGRDVHTINWHGYPDFKKLFDPREQLFPFSYSALKLLLPVNTKI